MNRRFVALWLASSVLALPVSAMARPVNSVFDAVAQSEHFFRLEADAVFTDDPAVVQAELLPSGELFLTAKRPGRALMFVLAGGGLEAVRIRVRASGDAPVAQTASPQVVAAARGACPGLVIEGTEGRRSVKVQIGTAACRRALLEMLAGDEFSLRGIEVMYSPEAVKDQLDDVLRRVAERRPELLQQYQIAYVGVTLRIRGKGTAADRAQLLTSVYEASVGPVVLDDGSLLEPESRPDAGDGEWRTDAGAVPAAAVPEGSK